MKSGAEIWGRRQDFELGMQVISCKMRPVLLIGVGGSDRNRVSRESNPNGKRGCSIVGKHYSKSTIYNRRQRTYLDYKQKISVPITILEFLIITF